MNQPLLSILIPTYNGGSRTLKPVLDSFIQGIQMCLEYDIELVVSDNVSTDNTVELLKEYEKYPFFRYSQNETNIGFARNIIKLTDELARGKYGWVVGDDDLLVPDELSRVIDIIQNYHPDYIAFGFRFVYSVPEALHSQRKTTRIVSGTYADVLDCSITGNILGTYMASAIFNVNLFKSVPKDAITCDFNTVASIFPNAYVTSLAFVDSPCIYYTGEVLLPIVHNKFWDTTDNLYNIRTKIVPELYNQILSQGCSKKQLRKSYKRMLADGLFVGYARILGGRFPDRNFWKMSLESLAHPSSIYKANKRILIFVLSSLKKKIRS